MTGRAQRFLDRLRGLPVRTMAIWLALIVVVFLTRNRWDAWVVEREFSSLPHLVYHAVLTPDREQVVLLTFEGIACFHVYDVRTGKSLAAYEFSRTHEALSDDSYIRILSDFPVSPDSSTIVLLVDDRAVPARLRAPGADGSTPRKSPDCVPLVVDARTGKALFALRGHSSTVNFVSYSPDGGSIVTASADRTARVWDAKTGEGLLVLRGDAREVLSEVLMASYSPDGGRLLTASRDGTVRVWDANTGEAISVLRGNDTELSSAVFCQRTPLP
ncbi:MAG: WD40 repeat domain-containing protein [Planctomycetota bacterium]|jgi:WD40 repeat protein